MNRRALRQGWWVRTVDTQNNHTHFSELAPKAKGTDDARVEKYRLRER